MYFKNRSIEPFNFGFFGINRWGIGLAYCDIEWLALETNRHHSVVFEIALKYCLSDSFVDCAQGVSGPLLSCVWNLRVFPDDARQ